MAKKKKEVSVTAQGEITMLTVKPQADKIAFNMELNAMDEALVKEMVNDECAVRLTIDYETPSNKFKPVVQEGVMKGHKVCKTCDNPNIKGLHFTGGQVEQLTNMLRGDEKCTITITRIQENLPFEQDNPDE